MIRSGSDFTPALAHRIASHHPASFLSSERNAIPLQQILHSTSPDRVQHECSRASSSPLCISFPPSRYSSPSPVTGELKPFFCFFLLFFWFFFFSCFFCLVWFWSLSLSPTSPQKDSNPPPMNRPNHEIFPPYSFWLSRSCVLPDKLCSIKDKNTCCRQALSPHHVSLTSPITFRMSAEKRYANGAWTILRYHPSPFFVASLLYPFFATPPESLKEFGRVERIFQTNAFRPFLPSLFLFLFSPCPVEITHPPRSTLTLSGVGFSPPIRRSPQFEHGSPSFVPSLTISTGNKPLREERDAQSLLALFPHQAELS